MIHGFQFKFNVISGEAFLFPFFYGCRIVFSFSTYFMQIFTYKKSKYTHSNNLLLLLLLVFLFWFRKLFPHPHCLTGVHISIIFLSICVCVCVCQKQKKKQKTKPKVMKFYAPYMPQKHPTYRYLHKFKHFRQDLEASE